FALDAQFRENQPHHLFQKLGVAPEDVKGLIEDQPLLRPVDEYRMQGPVEIAPVGDADAADRFDRGDDLAGPDRQPGGAQGAAEMHQISDERPAFLRHAAAAVSALTCSNRRAASLPWMRAMSSWYLSKTPRVSLIACGVSSSTSNCISASAQSMVSAIPGNLNRSMLRSFWM